MTAQTETETETILSDDEVATLNRARTILDEYAKRCSHASWNAPRLEAYKANPADYGSVRAAADLAEHAIFTVLNWTSSRNVCDLTVEQVHNRQDCRDCGNPFPYDPDADRCPTCVADNAEPHIGDPRRDPRTHPEHWTE